MPATEQSVLVNAPIEAVWARLGNFHDLSWAPNVINSVVIDGEVAGDSPGAMRILKNAFHETLLEKNERDHVLKYSIDDGPSPVSKDEVENYVGVIRLSQSGKSDGTLVEWTSSWDSAVDDAVDFCHGIYQALLAELANSFAGRQPAGT